MNKDLKIRQWTGSCRWVRGQGVRQWTGSCRWVRGQRSGGQTVDRELQVGQRSEVRGSDSGQGAAGGRHCHMLNTNKMKTSPDTSVFRRWLSANANANANFEA
ncbi:hypothetical protein NQD34_011532 [Periophthalmus magnuspinnatus]|nr:hypothetical protein NQD34_011532 [Periophthalmus magnuspinnatus]